MAKKTPKGWVATTLGDIVEPSRSRVAPDQNSVARYIGLEHIEPHTMQLLGIGNAGDVKSTSVIFKNGDVLYGKMRPYLNKVWRAEFDGVCSSEFLVFPERPGLNTKFLALRLTAKDFVAFANSQTSGERPRVHFSKLASFPLSLPPAEEQDRIVAKLELAVIYSALKINGRAAVVVPDNVLFEGGAGERIRRSLLASCDVHTMLRLPVGIWYSPGVQANVIFFDKKPVGDAPSTQALWIYDLRSGQNFSLRQNPIESHHLDDFIGCYSADDRSQRVETPLFRRFSDVEAQLRCLRSTCKSIRPS